MDTRVNRDELFNLIKEAVREVFKEEKLDIFLKSLPLVSKKEMEDIEKMYGHPSKKNEVEYSENIEL
ncbi:MAG: hypothetical protein ACLFVG_04920 [Candidatus Aminicenantes bacterium]